MGMMESFLYLNETFMVMRSRFSRLSNFEQATVDYIDYYNNKRIKTKSKGLYPAVIRN